MILIALPRFYRGATPKLLWSLALGFYLLSTPRSGRAEDVIVPPNARPPQTSVTATAAEVSNDTYDIAVDLKRPAINVLRYSPDGSGRYAGNVLPTDSHGVQGIVTRIGPGVTDGPASLYSTSTTRAESFVNGPYAGVTVSNISVSAPGGKNPVARESWSFTLLAGDRSGVIWDRTVRFLRDIDLTYSPFQIGARTAPSWVDTVTIARPATQLTDPDFNPLVVQVGGDVLATEYTSLAGAASASGGAALEASEIIANALRGVHRAGEEVHLRYRIGVVDTRAWFSGLPAPDRKAVLHALWYGEVSKQWEGATLLPGLVSQDAYSREARWRSLDDSLPLAASLWAPHRELSADALWWANYTQWSALGEGLISSASSESSSEPGFLAYRLTDLGLPLPTSGFLEQTEPSTPSFPIDVERLYAFTKDRIMLARLAPGLRLSQIWIESHPQPLFYGGAAPAALANLFDQVGDARGAAQARADLAAWKKSLATLWKPDWLKSQNYGELAALADYGLLTPTQLSDLHALILQFPGSEIPPASPSLTDPRSPGDYATGLWATVFRAKSGDADRAYKMALAAVSRILADPKEPYRGFDAAGHPTGASGAAPGSALVGMYAWGIFGFEPSTEENLFWLQPAIPSAWNGQTHSFTYEYALSTDFQNSAIELTCTPGAKGLDAVIRIAGIRPGVNRLQFESGGAKNVVDGTAEGQSFVFHTLLKNGVRYRVQFLPSGLKPGPAFQTARATAPDPGMTLPQGAHLGITGGILDEGSSMAGTGLTWDAVTPPGSFLMVYLSDDGGITWQRAGNGVLNVFQKAGKGLRYRVVMARGADEPIRLKSLAATYPSETAPAAADLPAETPVSPTEAEAAFLETFDTGLESAGPHDGGKQVFRDTHSPLLGAGSLVVVSDPLQGEGSAWLARGLNYDPAEYPYLDFWVQTRSAAYAAIWPELSDSSLKRNGLAYLLPNGKSVTPLLLLTTGASVSPELQTLGDLQVPPDGRQFHVSFNLKDALQKLLGPGARRVIGFRLVNYVDPAGSAYRFDNFSARRRPLFPEP